MSILGQGIMRIIISAETREAIAGLKAVAAETKATTSEIQTVAPAANEAAAGVTKLGVAAQATGAAMSAITGIGIGLAIAGVIALGAAINDYFSDAKRAKEATEEFELSLIQLKDSLSGILDQLKFEKSFTDLFDQLKGKSKSDTLGDDIINNRKQVQALTDDYQKLEKQRRAAIANPDLKLNDLNKVTEDILTEQAHIEEQINKARQEGVLLSLQQQIASKKELEDAKDNSDEGKKRLGILQQIKQVTDQINKPEKAPLFQQERDSNLAGIDVRVIQARISEAIQGGIKDPANADSFRELANRLKDLLNKALTPDLHTRINPDLQQTGEETKDLQKFQDDVGKTLDERMRKLPPLRPMILVNPKLDLEQKEFAKKVEQITQQLKSLVNSSIESLAEGLGQSLGGGGFGAFIKSFANVIGEGLKTVGRILIEAAIKIEAVKKAAQALATANPLLGVLAGVAAIAAGTLIESLANKSISGTKFATGGIVTGPTLGLVGEAGPEVIFPLDRLNQFIKSANASTNVGVSGKFEIEGNKLVTVLNRQNKLNGLSS